jgi:hypothetical protein
LQCTNSSECSEPDPCTPASCNGGSCRTTSSCGGQTPYCSAGSCVACLNNSDCSAPDGCTQPLCSGGACRTTSACTGSAPYCDGNVCGTCNSNSQCTTPPSGCYLTAGTCSGGSCSYAFNTTETPVYTTTNCCSYTSTYFCSMTNETGNDSQLDNCGTNGTCLMGTTCTAVTGGGWSCQTNSACATSC